MILQLHRKKIVISSNITRKPDNAMQEVQDGM